MDAITGAPIAGAQLRLFPAGSFPPDKDSPLARFEQADAQGRFEFAALEPEYYNLGVRGAGYRASYALGGTGISLQGPYQIVGRICGNCADVSEDGRRMDEAGVLHASVTVRLTPDAVIAGKVTDPLGNPMPGVRVYAYKAEGGRGA